MTFFDFNLSNVNSLECVSVNNQECKTRRKIININNNEPVFYAFSIKVNKCSETCNNINDPYALSSQTKHIEWHETWKCNCRLDERVCNNEHYGMKINVDVNVEKN